MKNTVECFSTGGPSLPSKALAGFLAHKQDVERLWAIHEEVAGGGAGRKHDVEVLNRAAIVFITACWESFVEDVVMEGFEFLLDRAKDASQIPNKVKALASKPLREDKNETKVWDLADGGWRQVVRSHMATVRQRWIGDFNTPKSPQVNQLFEELLGIRSIADTWKWKGITAKKAADKLDEYVTIRGNIAHRTAHKEAVYKNWGTDFLNHVARLVEKTNEAVAAHLEKTVGVRPW